MAGTWDDFKQHLAAQLRARLAYWGPDDLPGRSPAEARSHVRALIERLIDEANPLMNRLEEETLVGELLALVLPGPTSQGPAQSPSPPG